MFPKPCISTVSGNFFGGGDGTGVCGSSGGKEVVMAVPMNDLQEFPALPERVAGDLKGMGWDSRVFGEERLGNGVAMLGLIVGMSGDVVSPVPKLDLREFPPLPERTEKSRGKGPAARNGSCVEEGDDGQILTEFEIQNQKIDL